MFNLIEAQFNSKPTDALALILTIALTHGHFLNLEPGTVLPEPAVTALAINRKDGSSNL